MAELAKVRNVRKSGGICLGGAVMPDGASIVLAPGEMCHVLREKLADARGDGLEEVDEGGNVIDPGEAKLIKKLAHKTAKMTAPPVATPKTKE